MGTTSSETVAKHGYPNGKRCYHGEKQKKQKTTWLLLRQHESRNSWQALLAQGCRRQGAVRQVRQHQVPEDLPFLREEAQKVGGSDALQVRARQEPQGQGCPQAMLPHGQRQASFRQKLDERVPLFSLIFAL
jgi:hypothetical protein